MDLFRDKLTPNGKRPEGLAELRKGKVRIGWLYNCSKCKIETVSDWPIGKNPVTVYCCGGKKTFTPSFWQRVTMPFVDIAAGPRVGLMEPMGVDDKKLTGEVTYEPSF